MSFSSSHQKLYPSWIPPPCTDASVYRSQKRLIAELSKSLEQTTQQDLEGRLGIRRPYALDSTAGVSLPSREVTEFEEIDEDGSGNNVSV